LIDKVAKKGGKDINSSLNVWVYTDLNQMLSKRKRNVRVTITSKLWKSWEEITFTMKKPERSGKVCVDKL
jgi:hypothetical protein